MELVFQPQDGKFKMMAVTPKSDRFLRTPPNVKVQNQSMGILAI